MGYTIERLPGASVWVVRGQGEGHVGEADEIIERLRRLTTPADQAAVLFDLRELAYIPTPAEARYIGQRYGEVGSAHGLRMAYLALPGAQYGVARTVEILSGFRGVEARVFTEETEAMAWVRQPRARSAEGGGS
ncbi:MAG TPA: STAS/SEC14 domain-containing protein [Gemmatimonadales bacterium]|nr:STAS/SEC14 domain-containing protein [Gemmatimonadales bacterium]